MGQEFIYTVMPRINFTPSQLAYHRRVSKSDRSFCRNYGDEEQTDLAQEYEQEKLLHKKKSPSEDKQKLGSSVDESV